MLKWAEMHIRETLTMKILLSAATAAALLIGLTTTATETAGADEVLHEVVAGEWRPEAQRARDEYRNPAASLEFWGLAPGMTVLELQPGAGWWTEILAPYAARTGGRYYTTGADLENPEVSDGARAGRARFEQRFAAQPDIYGAINVLNFGANSAPLPAETFDFILSARSVHGWLRFGIMDKVLPEVAAALKPGGILAIEQHRAPDSVTDVQTFIDLGYVSEAFVIEQARKVGLELVARAEINANPRDSKDHPFGVWTLPPARSTVPYASGLPPDPDFDRAPFDAIGESDRMTLKFRKPR